MPCDTMIKTMDASELENNDQEELVVTYLTAHKDFFARHPELLTALSIPHPESGHSVSLIERQVGALRDENSRSRRQLQKLLSTARANEALTERLHHACVALLEVRDRGELASGLPMRLARVFDVAYVSLKIARADDHVERAEEVDKDDPRYRKLYDRIAHGQSVCDDRLARDSLEFLFRQDAPRVGSCALIPIGGRDPAGILALGVEETDRFRADLGTLYLDRLGEIIGVTLKRLSY